MNCESVHTHWIVLCLQARRTSDDPDRGGTVDGLWKVSPRSVCPETSSSGVITPKMKMKKFQGEIFLVYVFSNKVSGKKKKKEKVEEEEEE